MFVVKRDGNYIGTYDSMLAALIHIRVMLACLTLDSLATDVNGTTYISDFTIERKSR